MKGGAIRRSAACLSPSSFFKDPHMESPSLAGSGNGLQGEVHGDGVGNVGRREESRNPVGFDVDLNLGPPLNGWPFEFHQRHFNLDLLGSLAEPVSDLSRMVAVEAGFARMSSLLPENLVADSSVAEPLRGMSSLLQENLVELGVEPLAGNSIGFNRLLRESRAESAMGGAPFVTGLVGGSSLVEMREPLRIFGRILRQMGEELPPPNLRNGESLLSNTRNPLSRVRSRWQWRHMRRFQHDNTDLQASDTTIPTQLDCSLKPEKIADDLDETPEKSVNFDCNICLEMAKDSPVVTLCGHLFCWPCLYQWLYIHSLERKCPICKALILEKNIIPIYGRGKAEIANTNKDKQQGLLVIPPCPHAPVPSETQERELSSSWQNNGGLLANRGLPRDTISNAVNQVLDRLRVVQRLQRQYLEVRLQSRQRFEGRQVRSSNNSNSNNSGTGLVQDSNLTQLQMPVNVEARIGSMDSLHLNLPPLRQPSSGDNPHEIPEQLVELNELTNNRDSDQTSSPSQTCQRGTDTASGSSNADPELLHVRKRRRLN